MLYVLRRKSVWINLFHSLLFCGGTEQRLVRWILLFKLLEILVSHLLDIHNCGLCTNCVIM